MGLIILLENQTMALKSESASESAIDVQTKFDTKLIVDVSPQINADALYVKLNILPLQSECL